MARPRPVQSAQQAAPPTRGPEKKFGPYAGGVGVSIWINDVQGEDGNTRKMRAIKIAPRRYRDRETGEWRDAKSYFATDLPALLLALRQAEEYIVMTPIPDEHQADGGHNDGQDIPY